MSLWILKVNTQVSERQQEDTDNWKNEDLNTKTDVSKYFYVCDRCDRFFNIVKKNLPFLSNLSQFYAILHFKKMQN